MTCQAQTGAPLQGVEAEAREEYERVILGGRVQLRSTELIARWPEETHPWRAIFTQVMEQTQVRLLDPVCDAYRVDAWHIAPFLSTPSARLGMDQPEPL